MKMNWIGENWSGRGGIVVALLQLSLFASILNTHAWAAYSGFSQSSREYDSIFNDPRLLEGLNGNLMTSIQQDGHKILIEAENGCVIRGSIKDGPELNEGSSGLRTYFVADLKVDKGCEDEVASLKYYEPTSATRLQDFRDLFKKLNKSHYELFRTSNILKIEIVGTHVFRISSSKFFDVYADIAFLPSGCGPPENH